MDRNSIRKQALAKRRALSDEEVKTYSKAICSKADPYLHGKVAIYHAYGKEVDLSYLTYSDDVSILALPKTYPGHTIKFFEVHEEMSYQKSSFGIIEPSESREVYAKDIDVMLIPLVAFDENCHRMGHGMGFYDRYLANFTGLRIGIAYECQKFDNLPVLDHDETLDVIISESKVYNKEKEEL